MNRIRREAFRALRKIQARIARARASVDAMRRELNGRPSAALEIRCTLAAERLGDLSARAECARFTYWRIG